MSLIGDRYVPETAALKVKLDSNENPYGLPERILREIWNRAGQAGLHRYPDFQARPLREALARRHGVDPGMVVVGNGSNEVLLLTLLAFARRCGRLVLPRPTYLVYGLTARNAGLPVVEVPLKADFSLDLAGMLAAADGTESIIILCRPNNPTGTVWDREHVLGLVEAGHWVICDEAYAEFSGETLMPMVASHPNLLIFRTLSKAFALAGQRVGYVVAAPEVIGMLDRFRQPYNVGLFSQIAAEAVLGHETWMEETARRIAADRDRLFQHLDGLDGVRPCPSRANFILFRVEAPRKAEGVWRGLRERGVSVRIFRGAPGLEDFLRVTIGTPFENETFLSSLQDCLASSETGAAGRGHS